MERAADKALAALGQVRAQHEVQLPACAADVLGAGGFGVDLAEQVHIHRVVDGHKVIQLGDGARVVGIVHRAAHAFRVVV